MKHLKLSLEGNGEEPDFSSDDTATGTDPVEQSQVTLGTGTPGEEVPQEALPDVEDAFVEPATLEVNKLEELRDQEAGVEQAKVALEDMNQLVVCFGQMKAYAAFESNNRDFGLNIKKLAVKYGVEMPLALDTQSHHNRNVEVTTESFKSVFMAIFAKIKEWIARWVNFLKTAVSDLFSKDVALEKALAKIHKVILEVRAEHGKRMDMYLHRNLVDLENYVEGLGPYKKTLSVHGQFFSKAHVTVYGQGGRVQDEHAIRPDEMVLRSLMVFKHTDIFVNPDVNSMFDSIVNYLEQVSRKSDADMSQLKFVDPVGEPPKEAFSTQSFDHYSCERDRMLIIHKCFLGDIVCMDEVNLNGDHTTLPAILAYIASWRRTITQESTSMLHSNAPRLDTETLTSVSQAFVKIGAEMKRRQDDFDQMHVTADKLKAHMTTLERTFQNADLDEEATKIFMQCTQLTQHWIENANNTVSRSLKYGFEIRYAWMKYLSLLLKKDKEIASKALSDKNL